MQKPEDRKRHTGLMKKKLDCLAVPNEIRRSKVRPYFLWHLNFFEVFQEEGGFDVVIGNPPYVDYSKISNTDYDICSRLYFEELTYERNRGDYSHRGFCVATKFAR